MDLALFDARADLHQTGDGPITGFGLKFRIPDNATFAEVLRTFTDLGARGYCSLSPYMSVETAPEQVMMGSDLLGATDTTLISYRDKNGLAKRCVQVPVPPYREDRFLY